MYKLLGKLLGIFNLKPGTPEQEGMHKRWMSTGSQSQPDSSTKWNIVAETAPAPAKGFSSGSIPAGFTLATVTGDTALEALEYYAGTSPFVVLGDDRIQLRGVDIVRAVPKPPEGVA